MDIIHYNNCTKIEGATVATVGFFDGVHLGHRYLIDRLKIIAQERSKTSLIVTFDKHPRQVLHSEYLPMLLSTLDEKLEALQQTGADACVVVPFTPDFANISAFDFMKTILRENLAVDTLLTGYDNRFGRRREDGFEQYAEYGRLLGMDVINADSLVGKEGNISSSAVRRYIKSGEMEKARRCLGRCYSLCGQVVHGEAIGRQIGFPTANIRPNNTNKILPQNGVYAVEAEIEGETERKKGMMNIGNRPTFNGQDTTLEVNIIDFNKDIYGKNLTIRFIKKLREEKLFDTEADLARQLKADEEQVRAIDLTHSPL